MAGDDIEPIKADMEELQKALYAATERIYKESGAQAGAGDPTGQDPAAGANYDQPSGGGTYEADFKDAGSDE